MTKDDIKRRISVFILGLGLSGFGVAMTTQAGLGTTPISSLPYVLTFLMPLSLGMLTLLLNVFLVFGQVLLLGRDFRKIQYLQIAATGVFGFFIDLGMFVLEPFRTGNYLLQLIMLFCGCAILGLGISCQLTADVMFIAHQDQFRFFSCRLCRTRFLGVHFPSHGHTGRHSNCGIRRRVVCEILPPAPPLPQNVVLRKKLIPHLLRHLLHKIIFH